MADQANVAITSVTSARGLLVLRLGGELDISTVDACRTDLTAAIKEHLCREPSDDRGEPVPVRVVLDLSGLTFLAVTGLRTLAAFASQLEHHHMVVITVVPPTGFIGRLVHLAGFDRRMQIVTAPYRGSPADATTAAVTANTAATNRPDTPSTARSSPAQQAERSGRRSSAPSSCAVLRVDSSTVTHFSRHWQTCV